MVYNYHEHLTVKFAKYKVDHLHATRFNLSSNLPVPYFRTAKAQHSVIYTATKYWNKLPENIKSARTLSMFKRMHKKYLLVDQKS